MSKFKIQMDGIELSFPSVPTWRQVSQLKSLVRLIAKQALSNRVAHYYRESLAKEKKEPKPRSHRE